MNQHPPGRQISLKQLFVATTLIAVVAAFLVGETQQVVAGSIGCALCFAIGGVIAVKSLEDLLVRLRKVLVEKTWLPLVARIRWLATDVVSGFLIVIAVAIANRTLNEAVGAGPLVVMAIGLASVPFWYWQIKRVRKLACKQHRQALASAIVPEGL